MRRHEGRGISPRPTPSLGVPTASRNDQVGIAVIRATHVHDRLDSTHGALHHGCYLCVWERVTAYSLPTGRRRPSRDLICYLQNLLFRQAKLDAWGHGPLQCRREPRLAAWAPCAGNASTPRTQFPSNARKGNTQQDVRANRLQGGRARGDRAGTAQGVKGGEYREGGTESLPWAREVRSPPCASPHAIRAQRASPLY